jgi:outer membrane protein TolC
MKIFLRPLVLLIPLFMVPFSARAVEQLTLSEALTATLQDQPLVQASAAEVTAAEADALGQASRYLPRLSLSERYMRTDEPAGSLFIDLNQKRFDLSSKASTYNDPPARSNFETRLTLHQPLFDPGLKFDRDRAAINRSAFNALHERHREEAVLATLLAYLGVQQTHAGLTWAKQSLMESEELVAIALERERSGVGLHADTLRSEVLLNEALRQHLVARNALKSSQRRLALAIGREEGEVDIAEPALTDTLAQPEATASMQRGDLEAMALTVEDAALAARQQKANYLPRIGLQASYFRNDRDLSFDKDTNAWSVSAGLEWLLFDAGERASAVAGARARHLALELQQRHQDRQARLAVIETLQQAEEAVAQLELAQSSLESATASRELVSQRYAAGLAALTDLLNVQSELAKVRRELVAAQTGLLAARANVYFAQGTLLKALLPESETR